MANLNQEISDFLQHCKHEKKLSCKTQKCYQIDLAQFQEFKKDAEVVTCVSSIDRERLREYLQHLEPYKPKTIKRKIATLKAFFNFLEFVEKIAASPFRKLKFKLKEPQRLPKTMTQQEIKQLFYAAYSNWKNGASMSALKKFEIVRNISVIELLFATGIRVSELSNLTTESVDLNAQQITVIGKGNKERIVQICNAESISIVKEYAYMASSCRRDVNSFFINRLGAKLSDQSIRAIVRNLCFEAKLTKRITPHVFRHSFATLLLEEGVDIKYIQEILGHSSILTTQIYTHVRSEKQREILKMKHPRGNFSTANISVQ